MSVFRGVANNLTLTMRDSLTLHATLCSVPFAFCHELILKTLMDRKVTCQVYFHSLLQTYLKTGNACSRGKYTYHPLIVQWNAVVTFLFLACFVVGKVFLIAKQPTLCFADYSWPLVCHDFILTPMKYRERCIVFQIILVITKQHFMLTLT